MKWTNEDLEKRLSRLKKAQEATSPSEELKSIWTFQNLAYIEQSKDNIQEELHWEKFRNLHLNDKYLSLKHIEDIGLPADVAIVLSKRGTGKTYSYMNLIEEVANRGEQFVIVRNTKQELQGGVWEYFLSKPQFQIRGDKIYWTDVEKGKEQIGYLAHLNGVAQQWQGAGYEKVTTIIWDEATNAGDSPNRTKKWIKSFFQLTSTFFRNRIGGKVWIFGNLMKDVDDKISDELLRYLGINSEDNLRYIIKEADDGLIFSILYVNTGPLYTGANTQLMSNISVDEQTRIDLKNNTPQKISPCIVPDHFFTKAKNKDWGIITTFDRQHWMILIASEPYINLKNPIVKALYEKRELEQFDEQFYIIRCEPLRKNQIGFDMPLFVDDSNLWNIFKDLAHFKHPDKMKSKWYNLFKIIKSGYAFYVGDTSFYDLARIMSGRKDIIFNYKKEKREKIKKLKTAKK